MICLFKITTTEWVHSVRHKVCVICQMFAIYICIVYICVCVQNYTFLIKMQLLSRSYNTNSNIDGAIPLCSQCNSESPIEHLPHIFKDYKPTTTTRTQTRGEQSVTTTQCSDKDNSDQSIYILRIQIVGRISAKRTAFSLQLVFDHTSENIRIAHTLACQRFGLENVRYTYRVQTGSMFSQPGLAVVSLGSVYVCLHITYSVFVISLTNRVASCKCLADQVQ